MVLSEGMSSQFPLEFYLKILIILALGALLRWIISLFYKTEPNPLTNRLDKLQFFYISFYLLVLLVIPINFEKIGVTPHPAFLALTFFFLIGILSRKFVLVNRARYSVKIGQRSILLTSFRAVLISTIFLLFTIFITSVFGGRIMPEKIDWIFALSLVLTFGYALAWYRASLALFKAETKCRGEVLKGMELKRTIY